MTDDLLFSEAVYHELTFFKELPPCEFLDLEAIHSRVPQAMFERHNYNPNDLFFWSFNGFQWFGRKTLSPLYIHKKSSYKKCNQITAYMILGLVISERHTEKGVLIFYKPLKDDEKMFLFLALINKPQTDIVFPHPLVFNGREFVQPAQAWNATDSVARDLNEGELHLRKTSLKFLSQFNLDGKIIYDPACSTGKFLDEIKSNFPKVKTIGQDMNQAMIDYAKENCCIDELYLGDSSHPAVSDESVDFIFFRFLNAGIVSIEQALKLFIRLAKCSKNQGFLILFGFTPVLIHKEIFEMLNLQILQTIAFDETNQTIFQFYVLKKVAPLPPMKFEDFSIFNFQKTFATGFQGALNREVNLKKIVNESFIGC